MADYFDPNDKKNAAIINFFSNKSWLVIDSTSSTRTSIKKTICQLGSKMANMLDADNFTEAEIILKKSKPHFIIGDNVITGGSTTTLFDLHLKTVPNRLKSGFFIISDAAAVNDVATTLNYEMDGIISAPFTGASIISTLLTGSKEKVSPTAYLQKLEEGRRVYISGDLNKAKEFFENAISLDKNPYEGYFLLGKVFSDNKLDEEAITNYEKSVKCNSEYFQALNILGSLYFQRKEYNKSYDINVLMHNKYPTSPKKIPELIRLSILNRKYEDITNYLKVFQKIEAPTPETQICISAGLAVLGKYFTTIKDEERGIEALKGSYKFSNGKYEILKSITSSFQDFNRLEILHGLFESSEISDWSNECHGLYLHTLHKLTDDDSTIIALGEKLIKNKVQEILVYTDLIERAVKLKRKVSYIENLVHEGSINIPDCKSELEELLEKAKLAI